MASDLRPGKRLLSGEAATSKLDEGVAIANEYIGMTMGPKGWNVIIQRTGIGEGKLIVTKDGVSVANELQHPDPEIDMGVQLAVEASRKTNDAAGDGTTATVVLLYSMLKEARKRVKVGSNPIRIQEGMHLEKDLVNGFLNEFSKPIASAEEIYNVALVSCQDKDIARKIADIIIEVGKYGTVGVESGTGPYNITLAVQRGMFFNYGYEPRLTSLSPEAIVGQLQRRGSTSKLSWENDTVGVLIFDEPVRLWSDVDHIFSACVAADRRKLLIIADFQDDAAGGLQAQHKQGLLTTCVINRSIFAGETGRETLKDIAAYCGSQFLAPSDGTMPYKNKGAVTNIDALLGSCTAAVGRDSFSLTAGAGDKTAVEARIVLIEETIENGGLPDYDKQKYRERIARFRAGIGTITIFAPTEMQQQSVRTRVDDAVCAIRSANEEGIVAGGGVMLLRCHQWLTDISKGERTNKPENPDIIAGREIVRESLLQPARTIAEVSGEDAGVRIAQLMRHDWESSIGYNYWTEQEEDLLKTGIIDPKKVVRLCVENAVSIVGELLRSRATVAPMPKDEEQPLTPRERAELAHTRRIQQG